MSGRRKEKMANISTVVVQYRFPEERRGSAYPSTEERDDLPISRMEEISAWVYLAYSVNCGQKFEQLVVICD
jgi:hypothetical protein